MIRFILCIILFLGFFSFQVLGADVICDSLLVKSTPCDSITKQKTTVFDTTSEYRTWLQSKYFRQSLLPLSLAGLSLTIMAIPDLDKNLQGGLNWDKNRHVELYEDELRYAPIGIGAMLSLCGVKPKHPLLHQIGLMGVSYVLADFVVYRTKVVTKIQRPDSKGYDSFPSQHTSMAFVAATLLYHEFGDISPWISISGYTTAIWVAYARIADNHHYTSDVLMGAAVGILVTNMTYWVYDAINPRFKKNMNINPQFGYNKAGIQLSYNF